MGNACDPVLNGSYLIENNRDIVAISGISEIAGIFFINGANSQTPLTSLAGLEGLTTLGDHFVIINNNMLTSLNGLQNITGIGGELVIGGNHSLTSLSGLYNVRSIEYLRITGSTSLCTETAYALETKLRENGFTGTSDIENNTGTICPPEIYYITTNRVPDVVDNCPTTCTPLQLDADLDGIGDLCEPDPACGDGCQPACEETCPSPGVSQ